MYTRLVLALARASAAFSGALTIFEIGLYDDIVHGAEDETQRLGVSGAGEVLYSKRSH
jgi:hypothetical protein